MVSVVIPVANEQTTIEPLCRAIEKVLPDPFEILFVDDGSTDGTWAELTRLHQPGRIRAIRLRRNFGKTAALQAGFAAAGGEVVFTMDGDLQDDPKEIPRFLEKLAEGYDLVSGWKKQRHDPWHKVVPSRLFNAVVSRVSGLKLHDVNCGFKAYRGEVVKDLRLQGEMHRFTPVLAHALGYRVGEIVVTHHPRRHGRSHYGLARLFKGFLDLLTVVLLTRYAERPSHAFGLAAILLLLAGVAGSLIWLPLGLLCAVTAAIFLAAGWVAEILVRRSPMEPFRVRERLD